MSSCVARQGPSQADLRHRVRPNSPVSWELLLQPGEIFASRVKARVTRFLEEIGGKIQILGHALTSQVHRAEI